jgi:hypothetical protein
VGRVHPAALSALAAAGVPERRAREFIEAGLVSILDGHVLAVAADEEPMTGEWRALVAVGADAVAVDAGLRAALLDRISADHPRATSVVLRLPPGVRPAPEVGARLLMRYVRSGSLRPPRTDPHWTVRRYRSADREPVMELLRQALAAGYASWGTAADAGRLAEVAEDLVGRCGDDVAIFCAVTAGGFGGHATVVWDEDDLTGERRPELFDVFVRPEHGGSAARGLLVAAAADYATAAGFPLRGHVVGADANAHSVFDRLLEQGWRPAESYWALSVRSPAPWAGESATVAVD